MKTLLCSLNSKYIHSSLAVHYLAAGVDLYCKSDIDLTIMEGTINQQDSVILDNIVSHRPDLIAFSTYIWNITTIKRLLPILKNLLPDARILLGGPEVSYHPETVMMDHVNPALGNALNSPIRHLPQSMLRICSWPGLSR